MKLRYIFAVLLLGYLAHMAIAQPHASYKLEKIIAAPDDPSQWDTWREQLHINRAETRRAIGYNDQYYTEQDFGWSSSCYSIGFLMLFDQQFYDHRENRYLIESFIDKGKTEFGGYDGVVLWHAYPRIGVDDRNQFDFYRDMPGGLVGLRALVNNFHQEGIKVFINYNPWDTGTRREEQDDITALVEILKAIDADGIFLDTMNEGLSGLLGEINSDSRGIVLESELTLPVARIEDHHMSWAQWFEDSRAPGVLWNKWFERRHMMHQIKRWDRDHTSELHTAWMNGSGILVWENVFGSWNGWNERDKSILRQMLPIQRRYSNLFSGEGWTPLVKTEMDDVYASVWYEEGRRLWTMINRSDNPRTGTIIKVPVEQGQKYFNLTEGIEIVAENAADSVLVQLNLPPRGIAAVLATNDGEVDELFQDFLKKQKQLTARYNPDFINSKAVDQLGVVEAKFYKVAQIPQGMVVIDPIVDSLRIYYRQRECGFYPYSGYVAPPDRTHQTLTFKKAVDLKPFAIDVTPVTNKQYYAFIEATGYTPDIGKNFLKHWVNGNPPNGEEDHPVVYIDLKDARAYAQWLSKRLPTVDEWQYAAQGTNAHLWPWGNEYDSFKCNDGASGGTTDVKAFEEGRSAFGCYDMCGNTWEWTESEHSDGHTRYCIIKGGSYYKAKDSDWYSDGGPQPVDFGSKFILMYPGLDRCATIGFRCVMDISE